MATRVLGLDRLKRKLKRFPIAVQAEIRAAMEKGANEMVMLAKSLVPRDTGNLANSIGWTWGDAPEGSMALGEVRGGKGNLRIVIYAGDLSTMVGSRNQFQLARLQEFGTRDMPASPYFYVSWRALRKRTKGRVTRSVNKAARRIAAGG